MLRRSLVALVLASLVAGLVALPAAAAAPARQLTALAPLERALVTEVNALRKRHGLVPLRPSVPLAAAAASHSRAMASRGFFAHTSRDGTTFARRVERFYAAPGYRSWSAGENLLWSSASLDARRALAMWLSSPPHRGNLLSSRWREIGVSAIHAADAPGAFGGRDVVVVTANFGVRR